jgi:hypothetical protein
MGNGPGRISLLNSRLPPGFRRRVLDLEPGDERPYEEAEWRDALVVVERGAIEVVSVDGTRLSFKRGNVLFLSRLPLRCLRHCGQEPALLAIVSRSG